MGLGLSFRAQARNPYGLSYARPIRASCSYAALIARKALVSGRGSGRVRGKWEETALGSLGLGVGVVEGSESGSHKRAWMRQQYIRRKRDDGYFKYWRLNGNRYQANALIWTIDRMS